MDREEKQAEARRWDAIDTAYSNEYYAGIRLHNMMDSDWQSAQREKRRNKMRQLFGDEIQPSWDYEEYDLIHLPSLFKKSPSFDEICHMSPQECYDLMIELYRYGDPNVEEWDCHRTAIPGKVAVEERKAFQNPDPTARTRYLVWLIDRGKPLEDHVYRA